LLQCPLCFSPLVYDGRSVRCAGNHCYDISRQGYINFLTRPVKTKYDSQLFRSRSIIIHSGFYDPLHEFITGMIAGKLRSTAASFNILDAGCGEGSHLAILQKKLERRTCESVCAAGVDISKEGIALASRKHKNPLWLAADLANCPLGSGQFQCILNLLSPSNYAEFQRMLSDGGIIIKVLPEMDYLKELREILHGTELKRESYTNIETQKLFKQHFGQTEVRHLKYKVHLDQPLIGHLAAMTPLSWQAAATARQEIRGMDSLEITVNLTVLLGTKLKLSRSWQMQ